jgi:hypothetical protein
MISIQTIKTVIDHFNFKKLIKIYPSIFYSIHVIHRTVQISNFELAEQLQRWFAAAAAYFASNPCLDSIVAQVISKGCFVFQ